VYCSSWLSAAGCWQCITDYEKLAKSWTHDILPLLLPLAVLHVAAVVVAAAAVLRYHCR